MRPGLWIIAFLMAFLGPGFRWPYHKYYKVKMNYLRTIILNESAYMCVYVFTHVCATVCVSQSAVDISCIIEPALDKEYELRTGTVR